MNKYEMIDEILHDGVGCRPATDAEILFWNKIQRLEAELKEVQERNDVLSGSRIHRVLRKE